MRTLINRYTYREEWSEEDQLHVARCLEFPSPGTHGDTPEDALAQMKTLLGDLLDDMVEQNEVIPEPFGLRKDKGSLSLRVPSEVHRDLAIQTAEQGVSINPLILSKI